MSTPPEPRKPLTKRQRAEMALSQGGMCACHLLPGVHPRYADFPVCGRRLSASDGIVDEHLHPLAAGGSNDPDNRALLTAACARLKTSEYDAPLIAKVRRVSGQTGQQKRRAERKAKGQPLWRKGGKLRSAGFTKAQPQRSASRTISKWRGV